MQPNSFSKRRPKEASCSSPPVQNYVAPKTYSITYQALLLAARPQHIKLRSYKYTHTASAKSCLGTSTTAELSLLTAHRRRTGSTLISAQHKRVSLLYLPHRPLIQFITNAQITCLLKRQVSCAFVMNCITSYRFWKSFVQDACGTNANPSCYSTHYVRAALSAFRAFNASKADRKQHAEAKAKCSVLLYPKRSLHQA